MKLTKPKWKLPARMQFRITARHWHYTALVLLCVLNLALAVRLVYAWKRAEAGNAARLQERESEFRMMQLKTRPLRGLGKKIAQAESDQAAFYAKRFPATYSEVLTELGALAVKNNVLLGRVQYGQGKLDQGAYEIRMDASLSGDYAPIVRFINELERDKIFFLITGIALSGQQNGIVSLRMLLTTYLQAEPTKVTAPVPARSTAAKPSHLTSAASHKAVTRRHR
ncbi:MAG: hypothetical protein ACYDC6_11225 [Acidobacteriaceae bacterium]